MDEGKLLVAAELEIVYSLQDFDNGLFTEISWQARAVKFRVEGSLTQSLFLCWSHYCFFFNN
jgi:hypothetical protein